MAHASSEECCSDYEEKFQIKKEAKLKYKYLLQCSLTVTDDLLFWLKALGWR